MRISSKKLFSILFAIVILSQLYLPSYRMIIMIQCSAVGIIFLLGLKKTISVNFLKALIPLIIIFFIGFIATFFNEYPLFNVIKDITHIIKPILGLTIGYFIFKQIDDVRYAVKTVVNVAVICAAYHLFLVVFFSDFSLQGIRNNGLDNFFELFALLMLLYLSNSFESPLYSKNKRRLIIAMLALSCFVYFSRTMFVVFALSFITMLGYTKLTPKFFKFAGIGILFVSLFYAYLFSVKIDRNGKGIEPFFYKLKIAPAEIFETKIDRENHAELWDHWRGYEAKRAFKLMNDKPYSYAVGTGLGSLIDLKFKAPLGDAREGMRYISEIHNGYVYVLYKTGIISLLCMMAFLFRFYRMVYKPFTNNQHLTIIRLISAIAISYFFTTLVIMGIYNPSDPLIFILGGLLFMEQKLSLTSIKSVS